MNGPKRVLASVGCAALVSGAVMAFGSAERASAGPRAAVTASTVTLKFQLSNQQGYVQVLFTGGVQSITNENAFRTLQSPGSISGVTANQQGFAITPTGDAPLDAENDVQLVPVAGASAIQGKIMTGGAGTLTVQVNGGPAIPISGNFAIPLTGLGSQPTVGRSISAGNSHTCTVRSDGIVACWGRDDSGQASPPAGTFTQVSAGGDTTCGIRSLVDTLACWGNNDYGQASPPTGGFTQVSVGAGHTCGITLVDTVACWGNNDDGEASPPTGTFTQVSAGRYHTCGIRSDGTVACWGYNDYSQASPPTGMFTQISAGGFHTCGIRSDGTVACWGSNNYGQASPPAGTFTQISAGHDTTCAIRTDGAVACWGSNNYGQASPPAGTFTQVSAGGSHTCGIRSDGAVACWGSNNYGQASPPQSLANTVPDGFKVSDVSTFSDGRVTFTVTIPEPGTIDVLEMASKEDLAHTTMLQPANSEFVYAREDSVEKHAGTVRLVVKPDARGRRLVHHHADPVSLRLWVTYTPTGGAPRSLGLYGVHLKRAAQARFRDHPSGPAKSADPPRTPPRALTPSAG